MSAKRVARRCSASSSRPQKSMFQSSSTCAAAHASSDAEPPRRNRERDQRRAGERGDHIDGAEPPRIGRDRGARRRDRVLGLRDEHHAFAEHEARAERLARPGEHRVPVLRLLGDEPLRRVGAIADEIGAEIFRDFLGDRLGVRRDAVDDRVGKPRERHGGGIDALALRVPFGGDRLRRAAATAPPARRPPASSPARPSSRIGYGAPSPDRAAAGRTACAGSGACCAAPPRPGRAARCRTGLRECRA